MLDISGDFSLRFGGLVQLEITASTDQRADYFQDNETVSDRNMQTSDLIHMAKKDRTCLPDPVPIFLFVR